MGDAGSMSSSSSMSCPSSGSTTNAAMTMPDYKKGHMWQTKYDPQSGK